MIIRALQTFFVLFVVALAPVFIFYHSGQNLNLNSNVSFFTQNLQTFLQSAKPNATTFNILILGSSQSQHGFIPENLQKKLSSLPTKPLAVWNVSTLGATVVHNQLIFKNYLQSYPWNLIFFEISPRMLSEKNEKIELALRYLTWPQDFFPVFSTYRGSPNTSWVDWLATPVRDLFSHPGTSTRPVNALTEDYVQSEFLESVYKKELESFNYEGLTKKAWESMLTQAETASSVWVFYSLPAHESLLKLYAPAASAVFQTQVVEKLREKNLTFWNWNVPWPTQLLQDQAHVNRKGAAQLTERLAVEIQQILDPTAWLCTDAQRWLSQTQRLALATDSNPSVLLLGDSLVEFLKVSDFFSSATVSNFGIAGDTTTSLLKRLELLPPSSFQSEIIFVSVGINDLLNCNRSVPEVLKNWQVLIRQLKKKFPQKTILINQILPIAKHSPEFLTGFIRRSFIEAQPLILELNRGLKALADSQGVRYVASHDFFLSSNKRDLDALLSSDGIHLSDLGQSIFSTLIANASDLRLLKKFRIRLSPTQTAFQFSLRPNQESQNPIAKTEVSLHKEGTTLVVQFKIEDGGLVSTDPLWDGDLVGVFLGSAETPHEYYEFEVAPDGRYFNNHVQILNKKKVDSMGFQLPRITQTKLTASGWEAQFRVPLEKLSLASSSTLRANFVRIDRARRKDPWTLMALSPTGIEDFHHPEKFVEIQSPLPAVQK